MYPYLVRYLDPDTGVRIVVTTWAASAFAGAALGIVLATVLGRRRGLDPFDLFAAGCLSFLGGAVGAKIAFLALHGSEVYAAGGLEALLQPSGLVWYGGLLGGGAAFVAYARVYRLPLLALSDVAAPGVALGHAWGRIGCWSAGCCYGAPAPPGAWAIRFPEGALAPAGVPLHPVQLYEAAGLVVIAAVTFALAWRARRTPAGAVALVYLVSYAVLRLSMETFRGDSRGGTLAGLSPSSVIAIAVITVSMGTLLIRRYARTHARAAGAD